jgi:type I restriction enzyme, S subunit
MPENKNSPALRFPGFNEPWKKMKLSDIYKFYSTNSLSRENLNYDGGDVYNIHYGDIHTKYQTIFNINNERVPFINRNVEIRKIPEENYCQEQDLIIADASEDYEAIGKAIEIDNLAGKKVLAGLHTFLARPNKAIIAKGFSGQYLKSPNFHSQVKKIAQGTKVLSISSTRLSNTLFFTPELFEQQKIANFLSAIDERLEQLQQQQTLLAQYKKGCMQQIFTQQLRFKDEDGTAYPDWEEKMLGDVAPLQRGFDLPIDKIVKGKYPVAFSNGIVKFHNKFKASGPGVVTGRSGTIGKVTYVECDYWPHNTALWVTDFKGNLPKYIYYFYSNLNLERLGTGSGVPTLNRNNIHCLKYPFPSYNEQQKIADFLSSIDEQIADVQQKINLTQQFKKGLLQQMFI